MQKLLREYLDELNRKQKRRRKTVIAVVLAAIMLVSGVIWNLTQYGIAMTDEPKCGMEEHTHSDSCYTNVLVCGQEELAGHTHTETCYQTTSELVCGQEESEEHTHSDSCYQTVSELVCGQEESAGHTHTEACYEKQLVCGKEEHTHSEACYIDTTADVEDASIWNAQYADTKWKDAWGEDLVIAAKKQIGYKESTDNYTVATDGSHKGYTRYGQFAGDVYADWDAVFVNFCMHYAGLEKTGLFPKETETAKWHEKFAKGNAGQNAAYLTDAKDYEPQIGDILFFQKEKEETDDQMGIISSYDKEKDEIKVIEGNSDNAVKENKYAADDKHITAYLKISELETAYKNSETQAQTPLEEENAVESVKETDNAGQFAQSVETESYVVTARYGSEAGLPENAELKVKEYARDSKEFRKKYEELGYDPVWLLDIGFYVESKEVEPQAEVTVEVKNKNEKAVSEYNVLHFGDEGREKLESIREQNEDGEKIVKFTTESFSMFAGIRSLSDSARDTATPNEGLGATLVSEGKKNRWQIVDKEYQGNSSEDKVTTKDDMVRLQKNVVATDVENEFLVYLSIDMNSWWQNFFENADYKATESNSWHSNDVGTIVPKMQGAWGVNVSKEPKEGWWSNTFRIVRKADGETLSEITLWFSKSQNVTMFLPLNPPNGGPFLLLGVEMDSKDASGVQEVLLDDKTINDLLKLTEQYSAELKTVTDTMGDYIEFVGVESINGQKNPTTGDGTVNVAEDRRSFTWDVSGVQYSDSADGWATNVAELVYKVKLDVTKDSFDSCADNMDSTITEHESYKVNDSAELNYDFITTKNGSSTTVNKKELFPVPYVRGLLYDYSFTKKGRNGEEDTGWILPGAEFKLERIAPQESDNVTQTFTSDQNGKVSFVGLEWGTYRVTEIKAPDGYDLAEPYEITLCYTTNRDALEQDTPTYPDNMRKKLDDGAGDVVYNKSKLNWQIVKKSSSDDNLTLENAEFELTKTDLNEGEAPATYYGKSDSEGVVQWYKNETHTESIAITAIPSGSYTLKETKAPTGYVVSDVTWTVEIGLNNVPLVIKKGDQVIASDTSGENEDKTLVYTFKNEALYSLPEAGGPGIYWYIFSGILLMAGAMLIIYKNKCREVLKS